MRYVSRSLLLIVALLVVASSPAAAQEWGRGFFEKMSGPRFKTSLQSFPVACLWSTETDYRISPFWTTFKDMKAWNIGERPVGTLVRGDSHRLICLDFAYDISENSDANDVDTLIHFREFNFNFGFPLAREDWPKAFEAIEPGVGLGFSRFSNDESTWRFTVTPSVTVKPLKFGFRDKVNAPNKRWDWRSVFEISVGLVVFTNKVSNEDIGYPASVDTFNDRARWRFLYTLDAGELLGFR